MIEVEQSADFRLTIRQTNERMSGRERLSGLWGLMSNELRANETLGKLSLTTRQATTERFNVLVIETNSSNTRPNVQMCRHNGDDERGWRPEVQTNKRCKWWNELERARWGRKRESWTRQADSWNRKNDNQINRVREKGKGRDLKFDHFTLKYLNLLMVCGKERG